MVWTSIDASASPRRRHRTLGARQSVQQDGSEVELPTSPTWAAARYTPPSSQGQAASSNKWWLSSLARTLSIIAVLVDPPPGHGCSHQGCWSGKASGEMPGFGLSTRNDPLNRWRLIKEQATTSPRIARDRGAELAKLFTNTWRYIKFAAANQLYMIANDFGLDFERIRTALVHDYPARRRHARAGPRRGTVPVQGHDAARGLQQQQLHARPCQHDDQRGTAALPRRAAWSSASTCPR